MKKFIVLFILLGLVIWGYFVFANKEDNTSLKEIKVGEVTHSIFYAPQYAADALGYFEDEGIDVDFVLTSGEIKKKRSYFFSNTILILFFSHISNKVLNV